MEHNPAGSSVRGIPQARILEWVAMPFSRDLPDSGIELAALMSPALAAVFFATSATREVRGSQRQSRYSPAPGELTVQLGVRQVSLADFTPGQIRGFSQE